MKKLMIVCALAFALTTATNTTSLHARAPAKAEGLHKVLKRVIKSIRYKRDAKALTMFDGPAQGALLGGAHWGKASDAQKKEFIALFHKMFAGIAFPRIRSSLEHLETVLYEAPKVSGNKATVAATIVILHALKKQELKVSFDLVNNGGWRVTDVTVKGNPSMLSRIRDEQINKIYARGGWPKLIELLRKRVAKFK